MPHTHSNGLWKDLPYMDLLKSHGPPESNCPDMWASATHVHGCARSFPCVGDAPRSIQEIQATRRAFAARLARGAPREVVTWGDPAHGGDVSAEVQRRLKDVPLGRVMLGRIGEEHR